MRHTATAAKLSNFVVTLIDDVRVPAREWASWWHLMPRKGQFVKTDQVLGLIDDSDALIRKAIAESECR